MSIAMMMNGDQNMAEKYKAFSQIMQIRKLNLFSEEDLDPKSANFMAGIKPPTAATPGAEGDQKPPPTNNITSSPAFGDIRLSAEQEDEILLEVADYLISENYAQFGQ